MAGAVAATLALIGCAQGKSRSPTEAQRPAFKMASGPPANLVDACRKVARRTALTVYCPPVVPAGPVKTSGVRNESLYGREDTYVLSFYSYSLVDRKVAKANDPDPRLFPHYPNRGQSADSAWNRFYAGHWIVAAVRPARLVPEQVDVRFVNPHVRHFKSRPRHFTTDGVRATVLTGDLASGGLASEDHAIVYWRLAGTGYMASVHYDSSAAVAEAIARGLIREMVACQPRPGHRDGRTCRGVVAGGASKVGATTP